MGVIGLGATGGLFAAHLAQHHEVHVLSRITWAHVLATGLKVTGHADVEVVLPAEQHLLDAPGASMPTLSLTSCCFASRRIRWMTCCPFCPAFSGLRVPWHTLATGWVWSNGLHVLYQGVSSRQVRPMARCEEKAAPRSGQGAERLRWALGLRAHLSRPWKPWPQPECVRLVGQGGRGRSPANLEQGFAEHRDQSVVCFGRRTQR